MGASFPNNWTMRLKEVPRDEQPGWILESSGDFSDLRPVGKHREWARPLSWLWRFTQTEYELSERKRITVAECKGLLAQVSDAEHSEVRVAADLQDHLAKYPEEQVVSREVLQAWPL